MTIYTHIRRSVTRHSNAILAILILISVIYVYSRPSRYITTPSPRPQDDDSNMDMGQKLSEKNVEGNKCVESQRISNAIPGESIHHVTDTGTMTPVQLVKHMQTLKRHGIRTEYEEIINEMPSGSFSYSRNSINMYKNRYSNIFCLDDTRVKLKTSHDDLTSDYIHANYVDGFMQKNAFIAAQGPLPNTVNDFWRMVWQENVFVIVMTTRTEERGLIKCSQYWPKTLQDSLKFGDIIVTNIKVDKKKDYIVTSLLLKDTKVGWCRQVAHFQFTGWPDFGVPESAKSVLQFHSEIRQYQKEAVAFMGSNWTGPEGGPPILVHCSAGIGRTGTLCAIDITLARLEVTQKLNIYDTVRKMRTQRAFTVQTLDQYEFIHFAVIESLQKQGKLATIDWSNYRL
ncbi:tyrosine-protein phosphatase non-receptor type 9-like [Antedon mediterranea]|uniref:tyrosine-protein phosphatase non-receptor type 9-like n=1 Tax=Antedon mediterranea TaxID=105859 RepID=UPI003AF64F97